MTKEEKWTAAYTDADITFFTLVYRDHELADVCLRKLRRHFPEARVVVRSDGDEDPRHELFVDRYGIDYHNERRLFPVENGGAIVQRMFDIFLARPTKYLFKIDPDTLIHRRFRYLPARSGFFGTLQGAPEYRAVQGGCMGFTADVARTFAESRLLLNPELKNPVPRPVKSHWSKLARRACRLGLASFDWTLGWAACELQIPMFEFPEVLSIHNPHEPRLREPQDNLRVRYAITHVGGVVSGKSRGT